MTSLNLSEPVVGSLSSVHSIRDTIESYRRSQVMSLTSRAISSSSAASGPAHAPHHKRGPVDDVDEENVLTPRPGSCTPREMSISNFDWDEDDLVFSAYPSVPVITIAQNNREHVTTSTRVDERTALLPRLPEETSAAIASQHCTDSVTTKSDLIRQSTFKQTLFNATGLLLGIGMLSEPLAFSYAGWICGTLLIVCYGFITCHTAKILAGVVTSDSRIRSYADIGQKAFGARSMPLVSFLFCFETFSVGVVLITLYADSLNAIIPTDSSINYKLLGLVILIPTVFLPLSLLSYGSLLGIVSTVFLIGVVFTDGLSKFDAPGSLWSPANTSFSFCNIEELGLAFGLFMAGFGSHAALPSLARDMAEPHRFNEAMNYSFTFATAVYALIGTVGYLMFGNDVNDEISQNLLRVPGYSPTLNKLALWMLVVTPLTKFALSTRPLNIAFEALFGIDCNTTVEAFEADPKSTVILARNLNRSLKRLLVACERITFVCLAVVVSILVPNFGSIMAILGSFSVFVLCVIGPIAAKISLERKATTVDVTTLVASTAMAMWGTAAAFLSTTR